MRESGVRAAAAILPEVRFFRKGPIWEMCRLEMQSGLDNCRARSNMNGEIVLVKLDVDYSTEERMTNFEQALTVYNNLRLNIVQIIDIFIISASF